MTDENTNRINQLEGLFAEQDETLQTLNEVITRQDQEITTLLNRLEHLEALVKSLKESLPGGGEASVFEKPPHY